MGANTLTAYIRRVLVVKVQCIVEKQTHHHCIFKLEVHFCRFTRTTCTLQTVSSTPSRRSCMTWAQSTLTMWSWPPSTPPPRVTLESEYSLHSALISLQDNKEHFVKLGFYSTVKDVHHAHNKELNFYSCHFSGLCFLFPVMI